MAAAAAGDDGDLGFGGIRAEVDDFVLRVEGGGGVSFGDGFEGREDEVRGSFRKCLAVVLLALYGL